MKKIILMISLMVATSTSFGTTLNDVWSAFTFLYVNSDAAMSHQEKTQMGQLYLAILRIENKLLSGGDTIVSQTDLSDLVTKMNLLDAKIHDKMGEPRTIDTVMQVKAYDAEKTVLGKKLVELVLIDLANTEYLKSKY